MIRLGLTRQQAEWLQQHLLDYSLQVDSSNDDPLLDNALADNIHSTALLSQLAQAYEHAIFTQPCPVCKELFNQLRRGRTGQYCSFACKQKAYRQRRIDAMRRTPSRFLSDS